MAKLNELQMPINCIPVGINKFVFYSIPFQNKTPTKTHLIKYFKNIYCFFFLY